MPSTGHNNPQARVHVAVAVIRSGNNDCSRFGQVLIAKRHAHVHQGGLWEFPGGKVERGEVVVEALSRELHEELGITLLRSTERPPRPLIKVEHDYGDKKVLLDVWEVFEFDGEPQGNEGQLVQWVAVDKLDGFQFPAANKPIISACGLPRQFIITPEYTSLDKAIVDLDHLLHKGARLVLFRQPQLSLHDYIAWSQEVLGYFQSTALEIVLSGDPSELQGLGVKRIHMPARVAQRYTDRCCWEDNMGISVSCHNDTELKQACLLGADFVTLSPVQHTQTHPDAEPLGWDAFELLVQDMALPVYALGGLSERDAGRAIGYGAQGIAGISAWQVEGLNE